MIFRITAGVAHDHQMVAGFQGFPRDSLTRQRAAATPLDGVLDSLALIVLAFDMDERMWVAEYELDQITFDRLLLVFKVGGRKGMVTIELNARQQDGCRNS